MYTNQKADANGGIKIEWKNAMTTQVAVNKEGQDVQRIVSRYSKERLGASDTFDGVQFHFHAGSEHTIDGKRYDLEMHTVHLPKMINKQNIKYAALGIIFDVKDYTAKLTKNQYKIIDDFFESMNWADLNEPIVDHVPYGDLMMMIDTSYRWVYKGSVTTPPCDRYVYWNVLKTIYPIKKKHLDLFHAQLKRGENHLYDTGNWREI